MSIGEGGEKEKKREAAFSLAFVFTAKIFFAGLSVKKEIWDKIYKRILEEACSKSQDE